MKIPFCILFIFATYLHAQEVRKNNESNKAPLACGVTSEFLKRQEELTMDRYVSSLKNTIHDNWIAPKELTIYTEVQFSVSEEGQIYDIKISRSSGNTELDNSAIEAVKKITNVSRPPSLSCQKNSETFSLQFLWEGKVKTVQQVNNETKKTR